MGIIRTEDILAYRVGEQIVCDECITKEEMDELDKEDIITRDEAERDEQWIFCDRGNSEKCQGRIW